MFNFTEIIDAVVKQQMETEAFEREIALVSTMFIDAVAEIARKYGKNENEAVRTALMVNLAASKEFDFSKIKLIEKGGGK